ncbi:MAG: hypothetical protein F7C35_01220 [Desulfurococcales archaeon]|nr:hypothetical protein [Desulfurococcales archaeon]
MEDKLLERALTKAYEAALKVLEPAILSPSASMSFTLSVEYDEKGPVRLIIDVQISRRNLDKFKPLLEAAADEAARAFEKEMGIKTGKRLRLYPVEDRGRGTRSDTQKPRPRRGRSSSGLRRDS